MTPLLATSRMKGYYATPILPLALGKVRYVGEPIVGVVAESRYLAEDALELIEIDFEPLPVVTDPVEAAQDGAPVLHEEAGTNVLVSREFKRGDVDTAMAAAPVRVRAVSACTARPRWRSSRASVSPNMTPAATRSRCIRRRRCPASCAMRWPTALDMPGQRAARRCRRCRRRLRRQGIALSGGDFRLRGGTRMLGRPVKWTSDRLEDLTATSQAFDEIVDAELGLDGEGRILALRADVIGDVGAYSIYPWTAALEPVQVVSFLPGPYRIEHYRGRVQGGRNLEGADRSLSRRRTADLDLRDGAADRHGCGADSASTRKKSGCAISSSPRNFPTRSVRALSGTSRGYANA